MQEILTSPPPMQRSVANITSNLKTETQIDVIEINMGNLDNSVNYMSHLLYKYMREMRQGNNRSPDDFTANVNNDSAKVVKDTPLNDALK